MAAVTIATVGKKALEVLVSNKKGRKFLGYTVGIAIFILLIPVITLVGLFGWMAGDGSNTIDINAAKQGAVHGIGAYYSTYDQQLAEIESTFTACGLTEQDVKKADFIFVSLLTDHSDDEGFYYGTQVDVEGCDPNRLEAFSKMLAGECTLDEMDRWVNPSDDGETFDLKFDDGGSVCAIESSSKNLFGRALDKKEGWLLSSALEDLKAIYDSGEHTNEIVEEMIKIYVALDQIENARTLYSMHFSKGYVSDDTAFNKCVKDLLEI